MRNGWILALAGAAAALAGASAADDAPRGVAFKRPGDDYAHIGPAAQYYPKAAAQKGVEATVVLDCKVGERGALSECSLVSESSPGQGFGGAALAMARDGWIRAKDSKASVDPAAPVKVAVPFKLPTN